MKTQSVTSALTFPPPPHLPSASPAHPRGGVQLLAGHAVAAGARRAVRRRGLLRRGVGEGAGLGARRRAVRRQPLLQTAAPGAQDQVGSRLRSHGAALPAD